MLVNLLKTWDCRLCSLYLSTAATTTTTTMTTVIYSKWNSLTSEKESYNLGPWSRKWALPLDQNLFMNKQKGKYDSWSWLLVHPRMFSSRELWPWPKIILPVIPGLNPSFCTTTANSASLGASEGRFTLLCPKDWLGSRLMPSLLSLNLCSISKICFSCVYISIY